MTTLWRRNPFLMVEFWRLVLGWHAWRSPPPLLTTHRTVHALAAALSCPRAPAPGKPRSGILRRQERQAAKDCLLEAPSVSTSWLASLSNCSGCNELRSNWPSKPSSQVHLPFRVNACRGFGWYDSSAYGGTQQARPVHQSAPFGWS